MDILTICLILLVGFFSRRVSARAANLTMTLFLVTLALPVLGWMTPIWFLRTRATRRLATIDYELPELIDAFLSAWNS